MNRIARLRERLEEPLLVTNLVNVRYLCGFDSSNAALLVEQDRVRLFTDFRYIDAARAVEDVDLVQTKRAIIGELAETLKGRIGFETALPFEQYRTLASGGLDVVPRSGLVEALRAVKDESELALLRRACAITDLTYERLLDVRFIGRRERDVAWDLARLFHEEGAESFAFEFIVGSGPTGSRPHARAGDRKIGTGELVVIDAGCTVGGYSSDYTRTFSTGPLGEREREAYEVVALAQDAALGGIRAGLSGVDADRLARAIVDESEFEGLMGHGLGHGLGLEVHEAPKLSTESTDVLEAGNVVTVEPGVYIAGEFGIRIEDDVVVKEDGIENLSGFRKDLVEVG
ncbi:MAG: aminopeptidase P family protein [Actinobacteria bacterium]|nr:aminopeptidase P family protein [Actinomycetota bacterium]